VKSLITKLFRKKKLLEDIPELRIYADDNEKEIIDLVDSAEESAIALDDVPTSEEESTETSNVEPADENLETIETNLDAFLVDGEELEDTLGAELIEIDDRRSPQAPVSENMTDQDLEEALLVLFESSELIASELIEEGQETGEKNEEHFSLDSDRLHDSLADLELTTSAASGKDVTERTPELEDEMSKNLFVDLKSGKRGPSEAARATESASSRRESEMATDKIAWIESDQYYPIALQALDKKIAEFKQELENLTAEKEELKKKYECVRSILYLKNKELKKAVAEIFTDYWSLKISHMDKIKRAEFKENILIEHNGRDILVKIKGTLEDYPSIKFITEIWKDLHYSELGTSAEAALIVNCGLEKNPKERNLAYEEDKEQLEDLIFIDTRVLHNLTTAIIDGDLTIEEAKKLLFRQGRVEFDSTDSTY